MAKKPITSLEAKVKHTTEELYADCRRGKIAAIPKSHRAFLKAKQELDERIEENKEIKK